MSRFPSLVLSMGLLAGLSACGGGDDPAAGTDTGGQAAQITCNTAAFEAGAVQAPSAAQLQAYAATYNGDEGQYGPNPGDPFVKSAGATLVLGANGSLSYKGTAYTATSFCVDKAAGPYGTLLYVHTDKGHFDISNQVDANLGQAWGVSPVDGQTIFTNGRKP